MALESSRQTSSAPIHDAEISCAHCGLPVPPGMVDPGADEHFCCQGCRTVYAVLSEHGLEGYYQIEREQDVERKPALTTSRSYEEYDDPAFAELYVRPAAAGLLTTDLYLEGVHCAACVWLVERVPMVSDGVVEVRLDLGRSRARVTWDPARAELGAIARLLDSMGYPVHPFRGVAAEEMARREDRALLMRMGVAGAVAGNVMLIAIALYGGMFTGIDPAHERFFRWASMLLTLPAVTWSATVFYRGAWGALKTRALHMDVPVSIGILIGFGWGAVNTVLNRGEIYFDSVAVLVFFLLVGRWLLRRQQRSAADATELLHSLAPSSARLVDDVGVREVPVEALVPGALVEVRAGDSIPADGVVREGRTTLDLSLLTGESRPVAVAPGAPVHAGTVNLASRILVEVASTGENTRVGRLMALVEEHARRRAPVVQMADRLSAYFVATVLSLAAITLAIWWRLDPAHAVDHAVALLIVTCPCALGLATPLAVSAAIGKAARAGLLIKGGDVIERLARPGRLWLDKTGTVTEGRTAVVRAWSCREGFDDGDATWSAVACLERGSSHPVARALVERFGGHDEVASREVSGEETMGSGIVGDVDGREIAVGSARFIEQRVGTIDGEAAAEIEGALAEGLSPVVVAVDGRVAGVAALGDPLREDANSALERLRALGFEAGLLSGDHPRVVAAVAKELGIEPRRTRGGATPEDKLRVVQADLAGGPVVMVGDGVNDAAALAAATAGVGVHGGAEATLAAADVFVTREGLSPIAELAEGSRRTLRAVRRNLVFSLAYNVIGAALAMAGLIHPLAAAVLMPASSLTVIASSYRARTFTRE